MVPDYGRSLPLAYHLHTVRNRAHPVNKKYAMALCGLVLASASAQTTAGAPPTEAARAAPAEARAGTVKSVRGDVKLLSGGAAERSASAGEAVAPIDRITTGADSGASLVLRDGTAIVVGPSSRLDVKEFHFDPTTQDGGVLVSLLRGSLRMITGLIGKNHPDAIRVETPTAVIGIRGTDFIVQTDAQP